MPKRDLLSIADLNAQEIGQVLRRAAQMKLGGRNSALADKSVALLFEKPSLRTRASFHVAVQQLGGYSFYLGRDEVGLGVREPLADMARVLSRYVDCMVARVNLHHALQEMASYASISVINALSDWEHPCQALADLQTIVEHKGRLDGLKVAYIGDGNNVARSLCLGVVAMGASFVSASPPGYELDAETLSQAQERGTGHNGHLRSLVDPQEAVEGADVVYTDVWTSMGQEAEAVTRLEAFEGYQVDPQLLGRAKADAILMHPMPAHYGEEVPPGMLEHPRSVAFDQAENRLHAQKAVLEFLVGDAGSRQA